MQTGTTPHGGTSSSPNASFPTSDDAMRKTDDAMRKADETAERLIDKAHGTVDRLSEKVQPTMDALSEKASHAVDRISQRADQIRGGGEAALESTRSFVRENPIAAIGIAAVAGLLLGRMRH